MSFKDSHSRRDSFDTKEELGDKIDKLAVMIGKLVTRDSRSVTQFKPQIYQGKDRGQNRGNYGICNYNQRACQNRYRSDSEDRRQYRQERGRPRYGQNYRRGNFRGSVRSFDRKTRRGGHRNNYRNEGYDLSRNGNRSRERLFSRNFSGSRNRSTSNSRSRSGSRASTNIDRIRCYKCREYDHFTKDCPTSREKRELEQLQQMLNLEDEHISLKSLVTNTWDNFNGVNSEENVRLGHLNL